ncbi:uncharacterized protein TRUGW13939_09580 [Talaromyces rugulosus]|uniref:Myb-like DNA-binding domain-containing protein n=1 Tax=Talaromyces rugulosus TaxID=121627 RepID=A0A7H8R7Q3_TALRU|nr:uncharacterized protein TRUGW13939_09580 [Talaromyces rugulosus]QKX62419.1 hypothetical protein TRUGW13939_09580 [Talaromyces rugulosus]
MASSGLPTPRRSRTMPTEGHISKFLYSILKQLDLKSIDWSLVATELEISNGHAARMRYSRFKQQMEGTVYVPKTTKLKNTATAKGDTAKGNSGKSVKLGKGGCGTLDKEKKFGGNTTISSGKGGMEAPPAYSQKRKASQEVLKHETAGSNKRGLTESPLLSTSSLPRALSTPYALPLRSPTQLSMNGDDMVMSQQPHHYHHPYGHANPEYTTDSFARPQQSWHHPEHCFSGCCQPPPYPPTPSMYPSYPAASTVSTPSISALFPSQQNIHPQLLQQSQDIWVPVKQEDGEEGESDELFIKVETAEGI